MPVLDRIFAADGAQSGIRDPAELLYESMGARAAASGVRVTHNRAMTLSAYFACQRVISEDEGKLPLIVYRRLDRGKERAQDHWSYTLLHDRANPMMSSQAFRETLTHHALGWGNGIAEIVRTAGGQAAEMWPLHPSRIELKRLGDGTWIYRVWSDREGYRNLRQDQVFHLHGFGFDGMTGYSIAQVARESLGNAIATQEFGGRFFANGANAGYVYQTDKQLTDKAYSRLRESLGEVHQGVENAHKTMILEEGLKFAKTVIPPNDAQWLESKQFNVEEICRWHRVAPHKIQHLLRATFSNIEHQSLEHVADALMPWQVRWEQEIQFKIIRDPLYFAEHLNDALLRGDTLSRYQAHQSGITAGWKTRNEARAAENMNPLPGLDEPLEPVAIAQAPEAKQEEGDKPSDEPPAKPRRKSKEDEEADAATVELRRKAFARIFADAAQRLWNKEHNAATRAAKKHGEDTPAMREWLADFNAEHAGDVIAAMTPLAEAFIENETGKPLTKDAADWIAVQISEHASDPVVDSWKQTRAPQIATALIERLSQWQTPQSSK